ncbi:MAG: DUF1329 domain-containing protein [Rubrivivax sp.]
MKSTLNRPAVVALAFALAPAFTPAFAAVSAEEATQLRTTLTPLGAERAGNKDGSIPAWTGAPVPGGDMYGPNRRKDPFADDKLLYSVTAKNLDQYADRVSDGFKAVMRKYPESFRIDVYPTLRTGIAPQWVYDYTAKNAVKAKLVDLPSGQAPEGAYGGIPFPIPKAGVEVVWNHLLRWRNPSYTGAIRNYQVTSDGQWLMISDASLEVTMPYYQPNGADKFNGEYLLVRQKVFGPAIRAGEAITGRFAVDDDKANTWVYMTGQRRVRKLPNPCCDTPGPFSAGIATFDEVNVFTGRTNRFDWKLVGKREMLVPYNSNRTYVPARDKDIFGPKHLSPDHVRWELHRVWVVDATLRAGQRHTSPKTRYYFDEDTWMAVMAERYDATGTLTRVPFAVPAVFSDFPATDQLVWGIYDLVGGSTFISGITNEKDTIYRAQKVPFPETVFTPDAMAGEGVR